MIRALALAVGVALAGCGTMEPAAVREGCDVEVSFGSYAMGVDRDLKARIVAFVDGSDDVVDTVETPWGREGESTLCVQAASSAGTNRIYDRVASMIPAHSERAPTTVTHRDGRTRSSTLPPRS